ncbi:hypothetical protein MN608_10748 [Microdochium nivale]|nr:hypothetical protein MN608_10748 [Microdochium nivale]
MVPITASPHASYGHCRLYSPSGPIAVPDGQNLRHTSSLGRPGLGALRLLLSPGSPDVVDGLALTVSAAAGTNHGAAQSRGGDVVLLIDDELSGSPTGRPAAPHWLRAPYCRQRPLQLDWLLAAPSARTRVEQTGGVELARVTVGGDRQLLAGAVELYSAASGSSSCNRSGGGSTSGRGVHVRLFLAFELSPNELGVGAGGGKVKRHYCEIAEFVTPPPRDEMERLAASFVSKSTLEGWFEARLERLDAAAAVLAAGRGPQGQPWLVLSQKHFALRVLPELAISADSSQVVVVELSQNLHSARKSHKKDGLLRRILPRWAASDPTVESWLEAREALLHGPVGPSKS